MDKKEQAQLRVEATAGAVCAHMESGTDPRETKIAHDRLAAALATYRRTLNQKRE